MKENSYQIQIKNSEEIKSFFPNKMKVINQANIKKVLEKFFSFKSSFNELKESKIFHLKIIKSKISLFEDLQPNHYKFDISLINEIYNKYKNCKPPFFHILDNISKNDKPLNLEKKNNNSDSNRKLELLNLNNFNKKQNEKFSALTEDYDFENTSFKINNNNLTFFEKNIDFSPLYESQVIKNIFLNKKRKKQIDEPRKKFRKNMVLISNQKNKKDIEEKVMNNQSNKKVIFRLLKSDKNRSKISSLKGYKFKKQPGRKKKGSGEIGDHNKFSKDNMMRKLKNKVMESARKLINKMIKIESNDEAKCYREIRKIEGVYSQELNIKFNFWFYFQKLKDIFQFKMSSKYSKGDLNSNSRLISKIYSIEKRDKYPKTIQLFEMKFYEYYHEIFLGEKKNWYLYFDIKEKDNKYQLEYFLNNDGSKLDKDYYLYKNTIIKLAHSYELFFLKKNPRLSGKKHKEEKESHSKEMIKFIPDEEIEAYKYQFIATGIFYFPDMYEKYGQYLNDNDNFQKIIFPQLNTIMNNDEAITEQNLQKLDCNDNGNINNIIDEKENKETCEKKEFDVEKKHNNEKQNKKKLYNGKKILFDIKKLPSSNKEIVNTSNLSKNSYKGKIFNTIFNINNSIEDSSQKLEKKIQTDDNLIQDESIQTIEILI